MTDAWIKCSERMPEIGVEVIVAVALGSSTRPYSYSIEWREQIGSRVYWVNDEYGAHEEDPDYWHPITPPLPEAPRDASHVLPTREGE